MTLSKYVYIVPGISLFISCLSFSPSSICLSISLSQFLSHTHKAKPRVGTLMHTFAFTSLSSFTPFIHPLPFLISQFIKLLSRFMFSRTGGCRFTTEF